MSEDSYFVRSNFVSIGEAKVLMANAVAEFDFDDWLVPRDLEKRKIGRISGHPYVEDAYDIWKVIEEWVREPRTDP